MSEAFVIGSGKLASANRCSVKVAVASIVQIKANQMKQCRPGNPLVFCLSRVTMYTTGATVDDA
jgi:hypothetical protein